MIELKNERFIEETNEYEYDMYAEPEDWELLEKAAKENNMTVQEYVVACLKKAVDGEKHLEKLVEKEKHV